jgi:hypothetical protein
VLRLCFGGPDGPGSIAYPVALVAVTATEPQEYLLDVPLVLAECDWKSFRRRQRLLVQIDNAAAPLAPHSTPEHYDSKKRERYLRRNRLLLESLTLERAATATWPPQSAAVLLAPHAGEAEDARAERSLRAFLSRAFRRPVEAGELEAFVRLYRDQRAAGRGFLDAYRTTVAAALVSPHVFYLVETRAAERRPLTAWELASRLSYLVWNTTPDAELLARAAGHPPRPDHRRPRRAGRLRQGRPRRPRPRTGPLPPRPDAARPPGHRAGRRRSRGRERPAGAVLRRRDSRRPGLAPGRGTEQPPGRPAHPGRLHLRSHARPGPRRNQAGRVPRRAVPRHRHPDATGERRHPAARRVPRQHLDKHRTIATCSVCHQRIDPLGFVWDGFDMYGQPKLDRQGQFIAFDSSGNLPDKTPFADFDEFRKLLAAGGLESRFAAAFSARLYAYVLGRGLDHGDEVHLQGIRAAAAGHGGGVRAMLAAMVLSEPFRTK